VRIQGVEGTTEANGCWPITGAYATGFDLVGPTFANPYRGGGFIVGRPVGILLDGEDPNVENAKGIDVAIVEQLTITDFYKNIQIGSDPDRRVAFVHFRALATFGLTLPPKGSYL
jgi:hypothetical protein